MIVAVDVAGIHIGVAGLILPVVTPIGGIAHQTGHKLGDLDLVAVGVGEGNGDAVIVGQLAIGGVGHSIGVDGAESTAGLLGGEAETGVGAGGGHLDRLGGVAHQTLGREGVGGTETVHRGGLGGGPLLHAVQGGVGVVAGLGGLIRLDAGFDDGQLGVHLLLGGVVVVDDGGGGGNLGSVGDAVKAGQLIHRVAQCGLVDRAGGAVQLHGGVIAGILGGTAVAQHRDAGGIVLHVVVDVVAGGRAVDLEGGEIKIEIALAVTDGGALPIPHLGGVVGTVGHTEGDLGEVGGLAVGVQHRHADTLIGGIVHGRAVCRCPHVAGGAGATGAVGPVDNAVVVALGATLDGLDGLVAATHDILGVGDHRQLGDTAVGIAVVTAGFIQFGLGPLGETVELQRIIGTRRGGGDHHAAEQAQHHAERQQNGDVFFHAILPP